MKTTKVTIHIVIASICGCLLGCTEPTKEPAGIGHQLVAPEQPESSLRSNVQEDRELLSETHVSVDINSAQMTYEKGVKSLESGDLHTALSLFQKASDVNYLPALIKLAEMHEFGQGTRVDTAKAIEMYSKAAAQGELEAQLLLGQYYDTGLFVELNTLKASEYFKLAANNESLEAIRWLIDATKLHPEIANPFEVFEWKKQLADSGDPTAIYETGLALYKGWGTNKDRNSAIEYLQNSAKYGDNFSNLALANIFLYGDDINRDAKAAVSWLEDPSVANNPKASLLHGVAISDLRNFESTQLAIDNAKAFKLIMAAVEKGEPSSFAYAGLLYLNGVGTEKNPSKALEYFKSGSSAEDPKAIFNLGSMYLEGNGVPKDYDTAFLLINKASNLGEIDAIYYTGWMLEQGYGTEKNIQLAQAKYQLAKQHDNTRSANRIAELKGIN
ncbi:conserved hypothetical protein [Vibrio crassostreae]|nr:putative Sel1 repeat family protein [Vibrio chagasii]CAK2861776.1 conserved hypothetical protein [Vibrio crassostreae]